MSFNVKAKQHVYCWRCDNFQRFDKSKNPTSCVGECRLKAPYGKWDNNGYPSQWRWELWPVIEDSKFYWCGYFEKTTEKNLPDPPDSCEQEMAEIRDNGWSPWNKKASQNISCWNCDHFSRRYESPQTQQGGCDGWCRRKPPGAYMKFDWGAENGWMEGEHFRFDQSPLFWCGEWEKATHDVPEHPDPCPGPAVQYIIEKTDKPTVDESKDKKK